MAKASIGLASVKLGAIAGDGGMGTSLVALGATVSDSAAITTEEGTRTDFNIEESDSPFYSYETPGAMRMDWSVYDVDLTTLERLFGGEITEGVDDAPDKWGMPDTLERLEQSVEITTKSGQIIEIPRMELSIRLQWNLQKTALAQIDITGTILQPTKSGEKRFYVSQAS